MSENAEDAGARLGIETLETLDWNKQDGLIPAVVQDAATLRVLMLGYMNREALRVTFEKAEVTFFSRSKDRLWTKGESSGHVLRLVSVRTDCDGDALLVLAHPQGPTCHLQRQSCFPDAPGDGLAELEAVIARRERERPAGSYTTTLFERGIKRIAQKVGEEGLETALAAVTEDDAALLGESADLLFHLLVLLRQRGLGLDDVRRTLSARRG